MSPFSLFATVAPSHSPDQPLSPSLKPLLPRNGIPNLRTLPRLRWLEMVLHLQQPHPSPSIIQPNTRAIDPRIHHKRRRLPYPPLDLVRPGRGVAMPAERREFVVDQANVAIFGVAGVGVGLAFDNTGEVAVQGSVVAEFVPSVVQDGEIAREGAEAGRVEAGVGTVVGGAFGADEDVSIHRLGIRRW